MQKKIVRFLLFHNLVWTLPLTISVFLVVRLFHINWITALLGTAGSMAGLFAIARICLWFFFRRIHEYFYGAKVKPPIVLKGQQAPPPPLNPRAYYNHSFNDFVKAEPRSFKLSYATLWFLLVLVMSFIIFLKLL